MPLPAWSWHLEYKKNQNVFNKKTADSSKASPVHNSKTATATASVPQQSTAANSKTAATTNNSGKYLSLSYLLFVYVHID